MPTKHEGLSYKFPFGTEKKTYQFFDTTAKKAYPMTYKGSRQIQGLTVYRFEQPVGPVQIGESEVPGNLVGSTAAPSVTAPRFYDNLRTVWVEPVSGVIVKGQEKQHQVFRDAAGADAVTLIDVTLTFNEKTQKQQADLAKDARSKKALRRHLGPARTRLARCDSAGRRSGRCSLAGTTEPTKAAAARPRPGRAV